mmetsp:Transcript_16882/g.40756  ORF Transcript_16882/g.40756 Transcript_16882/m.40756 type:complete len:352 (+) Transcript_16882:4340-5395(+)
MVRVQSRTSGIPIAVHAWTISSVDVLATTTSAMVSELDVNDTSAHVMSSLLAATWHGWLPTSEKMLTSAQLVPSTKRQPTSATSGGLDDSAIRRLRLVVTSKVTSGSGSCTDIARSESSTIVENKRVSPLPPRGEPVGPIADANTLIVCPSSRVHPLWLTSSSITALPAASVVTVAETSWAPSTPTMFPHASVPASSARNETSMLLSGIAVNVSTLHSNETFKLAVPGSAYSGTVSESTAVGSRGSAMTNLEAAVWIDNFWLAVLMIWNVGCDPYSASTGMSNSTVNTPLASTVSSVGGTEDSEESHQLKRLNTMLRARPCSDAAAGMHESALVQYFCTNQPEAVARSPGA